MVKIDLCDNYKVVWYRRFDISSVSTISGFRIEKDLLVFNIEESKCFGTCKVAVVTGLDTTGFLEFSHNYGQPKKEKIKQYYT